MVDPMDDIAKQARQGSISAIIQVLNEKLATSGVRTRAMLSDGVLQLLCEAPKPEQLEQPTLVPQIRQILESLRPRSIRRVTINSRIVREQQLLWLEEINRDPENQLLWSEQITLKKPSLFKYWLEDWQSGRADSARATLPKTSARAAREKRQFWRGTVGGVSFSLLLLLIGWGVYRQLGKTAVSSQSQPASSQVTEARVSTPAPSKATIATPAQPKPAAPTSDPFVQAVRMAERAVKDGQSAQSSADWLDLASRWQRASDLMGQVNSEDSRYPTAQDRLKVYRQNSEAALRQAQNRR